jgi:hypothetical protein
MTASWSRATTLTWASRCTRTDALQECPVPAPGAPRLAFAPGRGEPAETMSPTRSVRGPGKLARPFSTAAPSSFSDAIPSGCQARNVGDSDSLNFQTVRGHAVTAGVIPGAMAGPACTGVGRGPTDMAAVITAAADAGAGWMARRCGSAEARACKSERRDEKKRPIQAAITKKTPRRRLAIGR